MSDGILADALTIAEARAGGVDALADALTDAIGETWRMRGERDRMHHRYEALRVQTEAVCKAIETEAGSARYLALMARSMRSYLAADRRAMNGDA